MRECIRIASRGSTLALVQTDLVQTALHALSPATCFESVVIRTTGDIKQGTPLADLGDKKDWILEIEDAVVRREVDLAVHSGKDVPCDIHPDTELLPVLDRAPAADVFLSRRYQRLEDLPPGSTVGASSFRRQAQLLRLHPELRVVKVRGNVPSRVSRLDELDGLILALAGLKRLGLESEVREVFSVDTFVPAVNQGTLVAQLRRDNNKIRSLLLGVCNENVRCAWETERTFICKLEGDCSSAIGVYAEVRDSELWAHARVLNHSGKIAVDARRKGEKTCAKELGNDLADELLSKGAKGILNS